MGLAVRTAMRDTIVSICIANYNGISILSSCLASVQSQEGNIPLEIIVHDDASTDGSVEFLRHNYPDITLIASEKNVGFCVANNRMAAVAKGEYLLLLNNDAMLFPDALISLLRRAKEAGMPAILGLPQYDAETGELLDRGSLLDPFLNPIPNLNPGRTDVGMVMGACLWIPRNLWLELEGFPEWFGSIGEDLYLCCLARLRGYSVEVLPYSGYKHYVGHSFGGGKVFNQGLRTTYKRRALSERNKTFVMLLCYPTILLAFLLPLHFLLLAIEGLLLSIMKFDKKPLVKIYLPVFLACWQKRKQLWQERSKLYSASRVHTRMFIAPMQWFPHKLILFVRHRVPAIT
jgi:GT2 family glycosyltransferase